MDKQDINSLLLKQLRSKFASTFFINGPPGAGKTRLLNELASTLPALVSNIQILGPYFTSKENVNARVIEDLLDLRYIDNASRQGVETDWYSNWLWLRDNLKTSNNQNFVILIRLDDDYFSNNEELRVWLSSIRYMEHYWTNQKIRLSVVVAGFWNHPGLENYYRDSQLSFPYITSTNYVVWNKIPLNETIELVSTKINAVKLSPWLGSLIHEITGGFAGAIVDLLEFLKTDNPSVVDVFQAAHQAVKDGEYGKLLINSWRKLPSGVLGPAKKLLLFQQLHDEDKRDLELLGIAGIVTHQQILDQFYAKISSWYMELLLRNNADLLGIGGDEWGKIQISEFAPSIATLNVDAYRIINNIENLIRNFALTKLYQQNRDEDHVLQNRVLKRKISSQMNVDEDAYERADNWREKSRRSGIDVSLNPLIAYISTSDLVSLLREISIAGEPLWIDIINAMEKITPIRDAVMHNQVINQISLDSLYSLQLKVFKALNW